MLVLSALLSLPLPSSSSALVSLTRSCPGTDHTALALTKIDVWAGVQFLQASWRKQPQTRHLKLEQQGSLYRGKEDLGPNQKVWDGESELRDRGSWGLG